jgi:hypothetical protein
MLALIEDSHLYRQAAQAAFAFSQDKTWSVCAEQYLDFAEQLLRDGNPRSWSPKDL